MSGIVPSRAVSVSVKVGGVVTWPATSSIAAPAASRWAARSSSSRSAAVATRRWRLGRSGSGLSAPTRSVKVSRSARPVGDRAGRCRRRSRSGSAGSSARSTGLPPPSSTGAACSKAPASDTASKGRPVPIASRSCCDGGARQPGVEPEHGGAGDARLLEAQQRQLGEHAAHDQPRRAVGVEPLHHDRVRATARGSGRGCGRRRRSPPAPRPRRAGPASS